MAASVAGLLTSGLLLFVALFSPAASLCSDSSGTTTSVQVVVNGSSVTVGGKPLSVDQLKIAQEIIGQGRARKLSNNDIVTALTAGYQESKLQNLRYGDRDSYGVYQQRPSQGWGTIEQILSVPYAVSRFYEALEAVKNRESKSSLQVALEVQRPDPAAYDNPDNRFSNWLPLAKALLSGATGETIETSLVSADCTVTPNAGGLPQIGNVAFGQPGACPAGTNVGIGTYVSGQKLQLCSVNGVIVEAGISANLKAMFDAARKDGIILSGSGYRSFEKQVALRRQNCGTSDFAIWRMSSDECSPPTAIPGESNHEKGRAVDLRSQYGGMSQGDPAHIWMNRYAGQYGFKPHPVESWHWSLR